jgi:hypothetical protein
MPSQILNVSNFKALTEGVVEIVVMAELGVAASALEIASLLIQVVDSISKLMSFCDVVKEVPEEIGYLIEEIEILELLLLYWMLAH